MEPTVATAMTIGVITVDEQATAQRVVDVGCLLGSLTVEQLRHHTRHPNRRPSQSREARHDQVRV